MAKKSLWNTCKCNLEPAGLSFHSRRDSDKRSQLVANLEDILQAFEALDSLDMIPDIYCEATELLKLPALSLDPVSDQVNSNSKSLETLICTVGSLEKKLSTFISSSSSLSNFGVNVDGCSSSAGSTSTFATVASKPVTISPPSVDSPLPLHQTMSVRQPMQLGSRDLNVVLFGLPESGSIVDDKRIVDEALEFLVDMAVDIRDMFRLGKFSKTSSRPRPLLVKVSSAWDRPSS